MKQVRGRSRVRLYPFISATEEYEHLFEYNRKVPSILKGTE